MSDKILKKLIREILKEYGEVTVTQGSSGGGDSGGGSWWGSLFDCDESEVDEKALDEDDEAALDEKDKKSVEDWFHK